MIFRILAKVLSHPRVFNYLLNRAKKTPYTHIYGMKDKELYMERYWLFNPYPSSGSLRRFNWCPISIRIHKIMKVDDDLHLHDHPWNARTFILKGWYREERPDGFKHRKKGDTSRLNFGEYHRITEVCESGVYTLFITGKYRGTWGFLVDGIKIKYREYLGIEPIKKAE